MLQSPVCGGGGKKGLKSWGKWTSLNDEASFSEAVLILNEPASMMIAQWGFLGKA